MRKIKKFDLNQSHSLSPEEMAELSIGEYIYTSCNAYNLGKKCIANNQEGVCKFEYYFSTDSYTSSWSQRYFCYTGA